MKKLNKNELGFGAVEVLLIIVLIGIFGGIGWYVWSQRSTKEVPKTTSNNSTTKTSTVTSADSYTTISEWGMKVKNPTGDTITYAYVDNVKDFPKFLNVRTKKLDEISGSCKNNTVSITRGTSDEIYSPAVNETPASTFEQSYNYWKTSKHVSWYSVGAKVGDYYYLVAGEPGASCSKNEAAENAILASIGTAFNNIIQNK